MFEDFGNTTRFFKKVARDFSLRNIDDELCDLNVMRHANWGYSSFMLGPWLGLVPVELEMCLFEFLVFPFRF